MTDAEKKLLQAKHRMEEAQARDRVKERKARTRRLTPGRCDFGKGDARGAGDGVVRPRKLSLCRSGNDFIFTLEGLRETGGFPFLYPKGRTYSPPAKAGGGSPPVGRARALSEGGLRLLREPLDKAAFLPNCQPCPRSRRRGFRFGSPCSWGGILPPHPAACLRQPATGKLGHRYRGGTNRSTVLVVRRISRRTCCNRVQKKGCCVSQ